MSSASTTTRLSMKNLYLAKSGNDLLGVYASKKKAKMRVAEESSRHRLKYIKKHCSVDKLNTWPITHFEWHI